MGALTWSCDSRANPRARALVALLSFVLPLLLGVLGHPFAGEGAHHVCDGDLAHWEAQGEHPHDEAACAACHLLQTLEQTDAPDAACLGLAPPARAGTEACLASVVPDGQPTHSFDARGPPQA